MALRVNGKTRCTPPATLAHSFCWATSGAGASSAHRVVFYIIGFGSGMTASDRRPLPDDLERIDCVEIEPAVIRAAPYLQRLNRGVLSDPRLNVIFDDARNFLLTSRDKYDLIISEPSNPWIAGMPRAFRTVRGSTAPSISSLRPAGSFVQWVQSYALAPADLRMIFRDSPSFPRSNSLVLPRARPSAAAARSLTPPASIGPSTLSLAGTSSTQRLRGP